MRTHTLTERVKKRTTRTISTEIEKSNSCIKYLVNKIIFSFNGVLYRWKRKKNWNIKMWQLFSSSFSSSFSISCCHFISFYFHFIFTHEFDWSKIMFTMLYVYNKIFFINIFACSYIFFQHILSIEMEMEMFAGSRSLSLHIKFIYFYTTTYRTNNAWYK